MYLGLFNSTGTETSELLFSFVGRSKFMSKSVLL